MDHGARSHTKYSGSNAHRFMRCAGQVRLAATMPQLPPDTHAIEGTQAHEVLELCIKGGVTDASVFLRLGHRFVITESMTDSVQYVLDYLQSLRDTYPDLVVQSEQPFPFPQSVVPQDQAGGIIDILALSPSAGIVWVIDFKHGIGETVEIEGNEQARWYGTSAMWSQPFTQLNIVVIQPRSFMEIKTRVAEITALDMVHYAAEVEAAIEAAERPDAALTPGPWCHRCPAGFGCAAREDQAMTTIFPEYTGCEQYLPLAFPDFRRLSPERSAHILRMEGEIRSWLKQHREYAVSQAHGGVKFPGFKTVEASAERRYAPGLSPGNIAHSIAALSGHTLTLDEIMPRKLVALTTAEAMLVKAAREAAPVGQKDKAAREAKAAFAFLTLKDTSGALSLVADDDKRPAFDAVASDFVGIVPPSVIEVSAVIVPEKLEPDEARGFIDFYKGS